MKTNYQNTTEHISTNDDFSSLNAPKAHTAGLTASLGYSALSLLAGCQTAESAFSQEAKPTVSSQTTSVSSSIQTTTSQPEILIGQKSTLEQNPSQDPRPQYDHISSTDNWNPKDFWYTNRDNIIGSNATDEWDPLTLINTDRPDYTDVAAVVGDGRVQIETGFLRFDTKDSDQKIRTETAPNALIRFGVGDTFEGRIKTRGYTHTQVSDIEGRHGSIEGLNDVELGFKWVIQEQENLLPMQSVVLRMGVPVGSDEVSATKVEPGLSYIYNWQVRRWWFFRGATGIDGFNQPAPSFDSKTGALDVPRDNWLELSQSVSSYFQISRNVGSFVEWFMLNRHGSNDDHTDHYHNYGLYLYATPDVQFDCRVGWRLGDHIDQEFWGAGISVRF